MNKTIFISCGQYSEAEKQLGKNIAELVRTRTSLIPFFAEEVQDLNGLDANILNALHECVAFITVLHPRGEIKRPDNSVVTRASVWIEQEIAIATYIQQVEKRPLPIIAFKHKSVSLEGIRSLLHLNPIEFTSESEVLAELPKRLESWKSLKPAGIEIQIVTKNLPPDNGHFITDCEIILVNNTNHRLSEYDYEVRIPSGILRHRNASYWGEAPSQDKYTRRFLLNQQGRGTIVPRERKMIFRVDYCTACAVAENDGFNYAKAVIGCTVWIDGTEYAEEKTIEQLARERAS